MPNSGYFDTVFATGGDLTTVPDGVQGNGSVSYEQGYGLLYSTPVASGGFEFPRAQHNQVLFDVTSAIQQYQQDGIPPFITSSMNNGTPFSYAQYAMVLDGGVAYMSLQAGNTDTPPSSKWAALALGTGIVSVKRQIISTTGAQTYTPDPGLLWADVEIVGGGGGGGGAAAGTGTQASSGTGGGASGYARSIFSASTIGASQSLTIGAGGAGGAAGANGGAGGSTSFGSLMTASGGSPGGANGPNSGIQVNGSSGSGATATGGLIIIAGATGGFGISFGGTGQGMGGKGGDSNLGNGGQGGVNQAGGNAPAGFGGGGGGAGAGTTGEPGGNGSPGCCVITEYCSQ